MKTYLISCFKRIIINRTIFLMGLFLYPLLSMAQDVPPLGETYCRNSQLVINFGLYKIDDPTKAKVGQNLTGGVHGYAVSLFSNYPAPNNGVTRCYLYRVWAAPAMPIVPGLTFSAPDGKVYDVYQSPLSGIGFAVAISDVASGGYIPIRGTGENLIIEKTGSNIIAHAGVEVRIYMIYTGRLAAGSTPGQTMTLLNLSGIGVGETTRSGMSEIVVKTGDIVNAVKTCSVQGNSDVVINLPTTDVARMNNINVDQTLSGNAESSRTRITFLCENGARASASFNDSQNISGSNSYLVNSTGPEFSTGVGVRLTRGSGRTIIRMGPISGGSQAFSLGNRSTADNTPYNLDLYARYVKLAESVTAGKVRARATINLEYR